MKTRFLIIIGIVFAALIGIFAILMELDHVESPVSEYSKTEQLTDETYLSKNVLQWQQMSARELEPYYEQYGDDFYANLGRLLIKNEMLHQLDRENIVNANNDFEVYAGIMLTSLPPHISFEAVVNGTDGKTYRLQGGTLANRVSCCKTSTLEFYDTTKEVSLESIFSNNTFVIKNKDDSFIAVPHDMIIKQASNTVNFQNDLLFPIRIQSDDGDWKNPDWYGPTVLPLSTGTMTFNSSGIYEWHARTLPLPGSSASDYMGGGKIYIIPSDVNSLTFHERQQIGAAILRNSEMPLVGIGSGNSKGITMDFNKAIFDSLPDAKSYYKARAEQLIPFDIPIVIEDPFRTE